MDRFAYWKLLSINESNQENLNKERDISYSGIGIEGWT